MNIQQLRQILQAESPVRLEIGTVIGADLRGSRTLSVRLSGGRVCNRALVCISGLQQGDRVLVARSKDLDRVLVIGKILNEYESDLSRNGQLSPPDNLAVTPVPAALVLQWDTYPGEDLVWQVRYNTSASDSGATDILVSRGSYYLHYVVDAGGDMDTAATYYFKVRALRWLGDNNVMYSAWSGWCNGTSGGHNLREIVELEFADATELTISNGVITRTQVYHRVDTQNNDGTDDLDTINGGSQGDLLVLRAEHSARTVVVKTATGNIVLQGGDVTLDDATDHVMLVYDGTKWNNLGGSGGGGGVDTFLELTDTPADYTDDAGKLIRVNAGEDALEFTTDLPDHDHTGDAGDGGQIAHSDLSGIGTDDHHAQDHAATHHPGGGDAISQVPDHDHSGDAGDGGQFDAANLTSDSAYADGDVLTADGEGGAAWEALPALGDHDHSGDAGDGGKLDHGSALDGLSDDDHPQYAAIAQNESISGTWTHSNPIKGSGAPTIGSTTEAEKWGHVYLALGKDVYPDGETDIDAGLMARFINRKGIGTYISHARSDPGLPWATAPSALYSAADGQYTGLRRGTYFTMMSVSATLPAFQLAYEASPIWTKTLFARVLATSGCEIGLRADNYNSARSYVNGDRIYAFDVYLEGNVAVTDLKTRYAWSEMAGGVWGAWNYTPVLTAASICPVSEGLGIGLRAGYNSTSLCSGYIVGEQGASSGLGSVYLYDDAGTTQYLAYRLGMFCRLRQYAWSCWDLYDLS